MNREPEIKERDAQPYLGIRCAITDGVPAAVDDAFPALMRWVGAHDIQPAAAPFIRVREIGSDGEPLELDVGCPVAPGTSIPPGDPTEERVIADELPAGHYLTLLHAGPYRSETEPDLGAAHEELVDYAKAHEIPVSEPSERGRTVYAGVDHLLCGPPMESDFSKWETEIAYLIGEG